MSASDTTYGELTKELRKQLTELLAANPEASAKRTSKGHTLVRASNGETMMISRNSGSGNTGTNKVINDFKRCFPASFQS